MKHTCGLCLVEKYGDDMYSMRLCWKCYREQRNNRTIIIIQEIKTTKKTHHVLTRKEFDTLYTQLEVLEDEVISLELLADHWKQVAEQREDLISKITRERYERNKYRR